MTDNRGLRLAFDMGVIRDWSAKDKADIVEFANNRNVWRNMADRFPYPYTEADAVEWISRQLAATTPTNWAIEVDGRAIGGIGIDIRDGMYAGTAEIGYWLGEPYWGRGIATAAARAAVEEVMPRFGLHRLQAHVFGWNPASMRVLEKVGFRREGMLRRSRVKDGVVIDQVLYAIVDEGAVE